MLREVMHIFRVVGIIYLQLESLLFLKEIVYVDLNDPFWIEAVRYNFGLADSLPGTSLLFKEHDKCISL